MNQILITEKLYITPELKRKKKMYKFNFFLSVFLVCFLFSYYIYAEFDRNKNEEISQEILASIDLKVEETPENEVEEFDDTTVRIENNVLIITMDGNQSNTEEINLTKIARDVENYINKKEEKDNNTNIDVVENEVVDTQTEEGNEITYTTKDGATYATDSVINIPSLGINYPVLKTDQSNLEEVLKISIVKFWGCDANEVGNYVVAGHNYKNKKMFGKLSGINIGDKIEVTDLTGRTLEYEVYDKYIVSPEDTSCTSQKTNGNKEITLITCKTYGTQRLIVKAREIKQN